MLEHTNVPRTDAITLSFSVPVSLVAEVRDFMRQRGIEEQQALIPWREALGLEDAELPATFLRGARYREGLTQQALSEMTGVPKRHISEMENGKRPIGKRNARTPRRCPAHRSKTAFERIDPRQRQMFAAERIVVLGTTQVSTTAAELLDERVLLLRPAGYWYHSVAGGQRAEYCGKMETYDNELHLAVNGIKHRGQGASPQNKRYSWVLPYNAIEVLPACNPAQVASFPRGSANKWERTAGGVYHKAAHQGKTCHSRPTPAKP